MNVKKSTGSGLAITEHWRPLSQGKGFCRLYPGTQTSIVIGQTERGDFWAQVKPINAKPIKRDRFADQYSAQRWANRVAHHEHQYGR